MSPLKIAGAFAVLIPIGLGCGGGSPCAGAQCDAGQPEHDAGVDAGFDPGSDGGADAGVEEDAGFDAGPPPTETCGQPGELVFVDQPDGGKTATLTVDTSTAADNATGSCVVGMGGRDRVYHFNLAAPKVLFAATAADAGSDVALYVRSSSCTAANDVACADDGLSFDPEVIRSRLSPGDYYLFLDNYDQRANGVQTLTATLTDPPPVPTNDSCAAAPIINLANGVATFTGDTTSATNSNPVLADGGVSVYPRCSPSAAIDGRDVVYLFTVPASKVVEFSVAGAPASTLDPIVYVRSPGQCGSPQSVYELGCGPEVTLRGAAPGIYPVWVDGRQSTSGPFVLTVTVSDLVRPSNDLCIAPQALVFDDGGVTVRGTTADALNQTRGVCSVGLGPEVFYAFTTTQPQELTAVATPLDDGGPGYRPALYVVPRVNCSADAGLALSETAGCLNPSAAGDPTRLVIAALDAGDWLIAVDGVETSGAFELSLSLANLAGSPANDSCATAAALPFVAGPSVSVATITGTAAGAASNHSPLCDDAGVGVLYALTTPAVSTLSGGRVNLKVLAWSNNSVTGSPNVYVQAACDGGLLGFECTDRSRDVVAANAWLRPTSTPHSVWVDFPADAGGGPFTLQVELASAPPPNDVCSGAVTLPLNTSVAGNTLGAANDYQGTDGGFYAGCPYAFAGADVVYTFTAPADGTYRVAVQPERAFNAALAVFSACTAGSCVAAVNDQPANVEEIIGFQAAANTTWFIVVDSRDNLELIDTSRGGFVVGVAGP